MSRILTALIAAGLSAGALAQTAAPAAAPAPAKPAAAAPAAATAPAAAPATAAPAAAAAPASGNVATVNGKAIKKSDVDAILRVTKQPDTPEVRAAIRDTMILTEVLFQEARHRKIDQREDVRLESDMVQRRVAINAMMREEMDAHKPSDAAIQAEYDRQRKALGEKEYKAHHVLVDSEQEAKDIIAKLDKGDKFEDLAKASKDTGSAAKGGELDWAAPGTYVKEFSDAMVKLEKGKYTATPVKSQYGYHVIRLDDVRSSNPPSLDQVKPQIVQGLQSQAANEFVEGLKKKAVIK
jgi:peptidyl-prolyl cis-trans isomerase C